MEGLGPILLALIFFLAKHFVCDFVVQSDFILRNRCKYGHPAGLLHVFIHLLGTMGVLALAGALEPRVVAIILSAEAFIHYHIDWIKDNLCRSMGLSETDREFWWLLGADQFLHHATYVGIVWYLFG